MNDEILINDMDAHRIVESIKDPIAQNLVRLGVAEARMRATGRVGQAENEWRASLPARPFDMRFFVQVLSTMFGKTDIVRALLDGQDLAQASGWDV
jgi:hypothetical protein